MNISKDITNLLNVSSSIIDKYSQFSVMSKEHISAKMGLDSYKQLYNSTGADARGVDFKSFLLSNKASILSMGLGQALLNTPSYICPQQGCYIDFTTIYKTSLEINSTIKNRGLPINEQLVKSNPEALYCHSFELHLYRTFLSSINVTGGANGMIILQDEIEILSNKSKEIEKMIRDIIAPPKPPAPTGPTANDLGIDTSVFEGISSPQEFLKSGNLGNMIAGILGKFAPTMDVDAAQINTVVGSIMDNEKIGGIINNLGNTMSGQQEGAMENIVSTIGTVFNDKELMDDMEKQLSATIKTAKTHAEEDTSGSSSE